MPLRCSTPTLQRDRLLTVTKSVTKPWKTKGSQKSLACSPVLLLFSGGARTLPRRSRTAPIRRDASKYGGWSEACTLVMWLIFLGQVTHLSVLEGSGGSFPGASLELRTSGWRKILGARKVRYVCVEMIVVSALTRPDHSYGEGIFTLPDLRRLPPPLGGRGL